MKGQFRAVLQYTRQEVDTMTIREYTDSCILLQHVLRLWHAPYLNNNE